MMYAGCDAKDSFVDSRRVISIKEYNRWSILYDNFDYIVKFPKIQQQMLYILSNIMSINMGRGYNKNTKFVIF